jgi:hypothetical protein
VTEATAALADLVTPVQEASDAYDAAVDAVADQQALIDAQQLVVTELQDAVDEHTTERAAM